MVLVLQIQRWLIVSFDGYEVPVSLSIDRRNFDSGIMVVLEFLRVADFEDILSGLRHLHLALRSPGFHFVGNQHIGAIDVIPHNISTKYSTNGLTRMHSYPHV